MNFFTPISLIKRCWKAQRDGSTMVSVPHHELTKTLEEKAYLKARIRAVSEHAFRNKKGECYLLIQSASGKFVRVQLPEVE